VRLLLATLAVLITPAGAAAAEREGFWSLLPAGQGTGVDTTEAAAFVATGSAPPAFSNQRSLFEALPAAAPAVTDAQLGRFLKPAPITAPPGAPATSPKPGVTIARDAYEVPYVQGATRADVMWGAGWAQAEDRLFLMDVLRHTARGRMTELIGPGPDGETVQADAAQLETTDYSDAELEAMFDRVAGSGRDGARFAADIRAYLEGVNAYVSAAGSDPRLLPAEYALLGKELRPFSARDVAAAAGLINGYFGRGGGKELDAALARVAAVARLGPRRGPAVLRDFRASDDPEAPVVTRRRFPFDDPGPTARGAVALPDAGSVEPLQRVRDASAAGAPSGAPSWLGRLRELGGLGLSPRASNAVLISAGRSRSGRALFTGNPQVDFYAPPLFVEMSLSGPGIAVRGGALPGLGPYVVVGRGADDAWTVTTAQGDNTDVFAERLCEPGGGRATTASVHYRRGGRCVPLEVRDAPLAWDPGPADLLGGTTAAPYRATLHTERSAHGPIIARGTVRGRPVAWALARSTYRHELETAIALMRFNEGLAGPRDFQRAAARVTGSYNWFYADARHIAYLQSGWYPRRARGASPDLPNWASRDWRGFDPVRFRSQRLPFRRLPKAIDPARGYLVSWNNKQAPGWRASDWDWQYGPVHRSQRLERRVRRALRDGAKLTLGEVVGILGDAATVDVRGQEVLPWLLRVIGSPQDPLLADAVARLRAWERAGAHRVDRDGDGAYDESAAVALMDAWFEPMARAIYEPVLGDELIDRIAELNPIDYTPRDGPDTWFYGWMGYVQRDLRAVLGRRIAQPPSRVYCGRGRLGRCRTLLRATLADAAAAVAREHGSVGAARIPTTCDVVQPAACDQLDFVAAGAIEIPPTPWQDRGSFQQAVEVR
jgi:acyl-homoserine lactone acylase PvdQ